MLTIVYISQLMFTQEQVLPQEVTPEPEVPGHILIPCTVEGGRSNPRIEGTAGGPRAFGPALYPLMEEGTAEQAVIRKHAQGLSPADAGSDALNDAGEVPLAATYEPDDSEVDPVRLVVTLAG